MSYTTLTIKDAIEKITNNKYVLPAIQREFVWEPEQIETLFDSIMQGYPVGTFLFWKVGKEQIKDFDFYEFLRNYHEKNSVHNKKIDLRGTNEVTAVLDGQQRLTSIYIGLKGTYAKRQKHKKRNNDNAYPEKKLYLNLLSESEDIDKKYDFRFLVPSEVKNDENSYWFEVGEILGMEIKDCVKYINSKITYSKNGITYTENQSDFAHDTLSTLCEKINSKDIFNYYEEKSPELDKVLDIFVRVNSGGTKLSHSDLLLSMASAQWGNNIDARKEIIDLVKELNEDKGATFYFIKDFVLKSMLVLTEDLDVKFKVDNFNKENMKKIENNWENIKKSLSLTVRLAVSFGYCGETLSSTYALIPIACYLMKIGNPDNFVEAEKYKENRNKIKYWLISALLKRQFGGQPDSVFPKYRKIIKENENFDFPLETIIEKFKGTTKSIKFTQDDIEDYLLQLTYGKNDTMSTLMLLYPSFNFATTSFDVDHIYPKSKFTKNALKKLGIEEEKIDEYIKAVNNIANLELLDSNTNKGKSDVDFDAWFEKQCPTVGDKINFKQTHYLPDMEYTYDNFLLFYEKRKEALKKKLTEILL